MGVQYSAAVRNACLDAIGTTIGAGGTVKFYTGAPPGVGNAPSGTLLSTLTALTFSSASGGAKSFSATADSSAAASGTPGYGRLLSSGGTAGIEADAAVGSGSFNFSGAIALGGTVTLSSAVLTAGNA